MSSQVKTGTHTSVNAALKEPSMYAVVMLNDDVTTMDFVVDVLMRVFQKTAPDASAVMMSIHMTGQGVAGVYTYDVAMTKKMQTDQLSREKGFPLRLSLEVTP